MCDSQQLIDLSGELDHSADTGVFKVQSFYHCEVGNVFFFTNFADNSTNSVNKFI